MGLDEINGNLVDHNVNYSARTLLNNNEGEEYGARTVSNFLNPENQELATKVKEGTAGALFASGGTIGLGLTAFAVASAVGSGGFIPIVVLALLISAIAITMIVSGVLLILDAVNLIDLSHALNLIGISFN